MDFLNIYVLSIILFLPLVSVVLVPLIKDTLIKPYAFLVLFVELLLIIYAFHLYHMIDARHIFGLYYSAKIYNSLALNYSVGADFISLLLCLTTLFVITYAFSIIKKNIKATFVSLMVVLTGIIGVFLSINLLQFYIFWEFALLPMLYMILTQGKSGKKGAALTFFIYTFIGSVTLLAAILILGADIKRITGVLTFNYLDILNNYTTLHLTIGEQNTLFVLFFIAFAVKVPIIPFHTWMPKMYKSAPIVAVLVSSMLLKMGVYGIYKILIPFFGISYMHTFSNFIPILLVVSVLYNGMIACSKDNMMEIFSYSSISHMGVLVLGLFALNVEGNNGAIFFMISHSVTTTFSFMLIYILYKRSHSTMLYDHGGLSKVMPKMSLIFAVSMLCSVGQPLTISFVAEFLSIMGFFKTHLILGIIVTVSIVLSVIYMLRMFKRTFFGDVTAKFEFKDITFKERLLIYPLVIIVIFLGIYPNIILKGINKEIRTYHNVIAPIYNSKLGKIANQNGGHNE